MGNISFKVAAQHLHTQTMEMAMNAPEYHRVASMLSDPYMTDHVLSQYWDRYNCLLWARDFFTALAPHEPEIMALVPPSRSLIAS